MSDKILYTGGPNPFKGLIGGLPEFPFPPEYYPQTMEETEQLKKYKEQVESIKSNAPDIVNWLDLHKVCLSIVSEEYWYFINHETPLRKLKTGDIFDLPVGYEFKKQLQQASSTKETPVWLDVTEERAKQSPGFQTRIVLRIVKTEVKEESYVSGFKESISAHEFKKECLNENSPEESQKELWEEVLKYCEEHYINDIRVREHMEKHFLIQRKK